MSVIRGVMLSVLGLTGIDTILAEEPVRRDTWQIQFEGSSYFDADTIRTALSLDIPAQEATAIYVRSEQYHDVVRDRIVRGYQHSGFSDIEVAIGADPTTGAITAKINEGKQRFCSAIHISGLTARECEFVESLIRNDSNKKNPLQEMQPTLEYWHHGSAMSFVEPAEQKYRQTIREALTAVGYPEAQFEFVCPETTVDDKLKVELQITVTDSGASLTVGDITFTGLEQHTPEQLIEFLELRPGMPLTLELREQIVRKLLDSGRFLVAEVKHGPYFFDPEVPLELQINVREYDRTVPLGKEMSESQQALMKLSQWLSGWEASNEDMHFKFTGPTEQANEVVHATVPPELHSFCDSAMGTGAPGHFCLDIITSPAEGSLFTLLVTDSKGDVTMRRTVLLTKSVQGLLAWQSRKKWLHADPASLQAMIGFQGMWPNETDHRSRFHFTFGVDSKLPKGLKSEIRVTPAAVMDAFHDNIRSVSNQNRVQRLTMEYGELLLNSESGALRELKVGAEDTCMELHSGTGLLAKELARIQDETKDWPNQNQPDRAWTGLASMIVEDIRSAQMDDDDALHLCLDLLRNEAAVARFSKGLETVEERRSMVIPPDGPGKTSGESVFSRELTWIAVASPSGSFPHRFGILTNQTKATGDIQLLSRFLAELLETDQNGAINCLLVAHTFGGAVESSGRIARAGLERLTTARFERDIEPLINQPCYFREVVCSLLAWLQQASDEDVDRIVRVAALYLKDQDDQPINIRPLLALIRSQSDRTPEEVLASLPPVIWEGGLRNWVETSLKSHSKSRPGDTKSYFNAASKGIPNWQGFQTKSEEAKQKKPEESTDGKTPAKSAARTKLLEDLSLDEEWDLD